MNGRYEDWIDLDEETYESKKEKMIEVSLKAIEKLIPGVRDKIDFLQASTPKTINTSTHHEKGSFREPSFEGLDISTSRTNK